MKPFWKRVNRSEPQHGAFAALYMIDKGTVPSYPDDASVKFRNDVVHNGRMPKSADVVAYGEKVLSFILPLYAEYSMTDAFLFANAYERMQELQTKSEPITAASYYATAIRNLRAASGKATFQDAVAFAETGGFLETGAT